MSDRSSSEQRAFIEALQRGEPAAFRALIERHQRPIYMLCLRLMSDTAEAEDMTQETFIKASQAIKSFRHEALLSTWLYRIATNLCKNRIGYLKRRQQNSHDHLASLEAKTGDLWQRRAESVVSHDQPEAAAESKEAQEMIIQALDSLPEKQKNGAHFKRYSGAELCRDRRYHRVLSRDSEIKNTSGSLTLGQGISGIIEWGGEER